VIFFIEVLIATKKMRVTEPLQMLLFWDSSGAPLGAGNGHFPAGTQVTRRRTYDCYEEWKKIISVTQLAGILTFHVE
jgi:hypothetical protein